MIFSHVNIYIYMLWNFSKFKVQNSKLSRILSWVLFEVGSFEVESFKVKSFSKLSPFRSWVFRSWVIRSWVVRSSVVRSSVGEPNFIRKWFHFAKFREIPNREFRRIPYIFVSVTSYVFYWNKNNKILDDKTEGETVERWRRETSK